MEKVIASRRPAHFRIVLHPDAGVGQTVEEDAVEAGLRVVRRRIEKDARLRSVILHLWVTGTP